MSKAPVFDRIYEDYLVSVARSRKGFKNNELMAFWPRQFCGFVLSYFCNFNDLADLPCEKGGQNAQVNCSTEITF